MADATHLLCRVESLNLELGHASGALQGIAGMLDAVRATARREPQAVDGELAAITALIEGLVARLRVGPAEQARAA